MKSFIFIDLALLVLFAFMCSPATRSEPSMLGVFVGTSPCDSVARKPFQIPATADCEMIKWNLSLFQHADTLEPATYELNFTFGMPQPNTNGFVAGGTKGVRRGTWTTAHRTEAEPNAVTLVLAGQRAEGPMSFLKLDHNLLHLLDGDGNLAVGNAGWSYTLSRTDNVRQQTLPPIAAATASPQPHSLTTLSSSAATPSALLGRFVGRSPCVEIARDLNIKVEADCMKLKWDLTLYQNAQTLAPATYKLRGTFYRERTREGTWSVLRGNPAAVVYRLDGDASHGPLFLLKADDNILLFLDRAGNQMVGNKDFSYTLNREIKR